MSQGRNDPWPFLFALQTKSFTGFFKSKGWSEFLVVFLLQAHLAFPPEIMDFRYSDHSCIFQVVEEAGGARGKIDILRKQANRLKKRTRRVA
jgi:hypothetical protein